MKNIKLTLQYDGYAYHGWQIQTNAATVQETVQNALSELTGERISLTGCGRTDAGVHAVSYICNFKTECDIPPERYSFALNTRLPDDIVCRHSEEAAEDFHAKYSAKKKNYIYKILNTRFPDAFLRHRAWHVKERLDIEKMQLAARAFVGTHDFVGFASAGLTVKTTVRTIYKSEVYRSGDLIIIDLEGSGFLYNMVRIIAGTLVYVGTGRIAAEDTADIIASCDRRRAGITAPPDGLYLLGVEY